MLTPEKHRITESIEIDLPVETVFNFIRDIESSMRLSPSYELVGFKNLTGGGIGKGTKYRVEWMSGGERGEFVSEVETFVENKKIVTREAEGRATLTLKLKPSPKGTLLIHDESFEIPIGSPDLKLEEEEKEKEVESVAQDIGEGIKELSIFVFGDPEVLKKIDAIKAKLREDLKVWLGRIKDALEKQYGHERACTRC